MYRDSKVDPVVKYYDETLALSGKSELSWYEKKVITYGGPVLDIACGTGRLSLFFAKKGYLVTAIDNSQGMLSVFQDKLHKHPELRRRISVHRLSMSNFSFPQKFNTILCVDAYFHNLTPLDEKKCLNCVSRHLNPRGRFFFNVHNYDPKFIEMCRESRGEKWTERKKYWINNKKEQIILEQALDIDEDEQLIITLLRFKRYNKKGDFLSLEHSKWMSHYRTQDHYEKLIMEMGLVVENLVGSYENGSVNENSQLIFQIKRAE